MLPPRAIVFDLDGTLIDSRGDIVASMNHALVKSGREPLSAPEIVRYIGDGARALCARAADLAEMDEEVDHLIALFLDYYVKHPVDFTRWSPGAQEVLAALGETPGLSLAICTNKPRRAADAVIEALGVKGRFRVVVAGGDLPEKKPAPGPLLHVGRLLSMAPGAMVMVGDGPQDIECARRAKVRSIGVGSGFVPPQRVQRANPDVFIPSLAELPEVLRQWEDAMPAGG